MRSTKCSTSLPPEEISKEGPEEDEYQQSPGEIGIIGKTVKAGELVPEKIGQDQKQKQRQEKYQSSIEVKSPGDIPLEQTMQGPLGAAARALHTGSPKYQTLRKRQFGRVIIGIDIQKEESEQYREDNAHLLQNMILFCQCESVKGTVSDLVLE